MRKISKLDCVEFVGLILHGARIGCAGKKPELKAPDFTSDYVFQLITRLERRKLDTDRVFSGCYNSIDISSHVDEIIEVDPKWCEFGFTWFLTDKDRQMLAISEMDLLIPLSSGILPEDFSRAASIGALSLQYGSGQNPHGLPTGFWEVFRRGSRSGFEIQHRKESAIPGEVIERGSVATQTYYLRNQAHLYLTGGQRLSALIESIGLTGEIPTGESKISFSELPRGAPTFLQLARYLWSQASRVSKRKFWNLVGLSGKFHVGIVRSSWPSANFLDSQGIQPPKGSWLADPFVIRRNGRDYCFVEEFVEDTGRGRISVFDITELKVTYVGVALEEEFHLSFPYVFEHDGDLFMCPESHEANEIRLYRNTGDILSWELDTVLVRNVSAVDSLIFSQLGMWTLLTSIDETGAGDFSTGLWCFQSDQLQSSNWRQQSWKPANVQGECMRNGGLLESDGEFFRVGQVADFGEYGSRVHISRVVSSGSRYSEKFSSAVTPRNIRGATGLHHISSAENVTVFDYFSKS